MSEYKYSGGGLIDKPIKFADLIRSPTKFLALGGGTGLAPFAPGTFGTLPALLLWIPMSALHWQVYAVLVLVMAIAGFWICQQASGELGKHDHGSIVWDEIVGYLVTVFAIPFSITAMLAGFVLFRIFDIFKPWPVSYFDKSVGGGAGIMLDDILAGAISCIILHLALWQFPALFAWG